MFYQDFERNRLLQGARAVRLQTFAGGVALLAAAPSWAQSVDYGPGGGVSQSGAVTAGHVASWAGPGAIQDGGLLSGTGTVTSVGLSAPSWLSISGSPVTTAGTLAISGAPQAANLVLASPAGSTGALAPRPIDGTDLPTPTPSSLGGINSIAGAAHQWLDSISTGGIPHASQPSCSDLADAAASCSIDGTNAGNITSGVLASARLPTVISSNTTFSGNNMYAGTSAWVGSLYVPIRTITAAGAVTVSTATDYMIVVNKTVPAPTMVNFTCSPGFTLLVKDGAGNDATNPITLQPTAGTIDGASSFVMNSSTPGSLPYEARAVTCDATGNSWVN
jgi:hypothetical protein